MNEQKLQINPTADPCAICTKLLTAEPTHTLNCEHTFHTGCIMTWFRSGGTTCPLCRDTDPDHSLCYLNCKARATFLRRRARNKKAPKSLKALVARLRAAEATKRNNRIELKAFRKENKEIINQGLKMRRRRWTDSTRIDRIRRQLGLYTHPDYPIPILFRCPRRRLRRSRQY